jgi:hypothetical protein
MDQRAIDGQLLKIVSTPPPATSVDLRTTMQEIDNLLPSSDGLKWFNLLYIRVTQQVNGNPPPGGWKDPAWLARLDVAFVQFYFTAIQNWLNNSADVPSSWKALFEARFSPGVERVQFALAGMNAHINHDLALALLQVDKGLDLIPDKVSPEHDDFEYVNGLLDATLPVALRFLATGILGELAQDAGKVGRLLAIWSIRAARDLAWDFADHLRSLAGEARAVALTAQDQITGVMGRSLLLAA